jgi:poly-gamma-glutamate capsule biosynthesis protein CapA/YwtB (metallophosphatase superfamily)
MKSRTRIVFALTFSTACSQSAPIGDALPDEEVEARQKLRSTPVALTGRVLSASGQPMSGATVSVGEQRVVTDGSGGFLLAGLPRENALVRFEAPGHRPELVVAKLRVAPSVSETSLDDLRLSSDDGGARLLFTGDFALARRFLDPEDQTPRDRMPDDSPAALVQVRRPEQGSRKAVSWVKPLFELSDYRVVNLESPVTDRPDTPHRTKPFAFFSLPGSMEALRHLGVEYSILGNNHVYDYLQPGLEDSFRHIEAAGLAHSGAGMNADEAFTPLRQSIKGDNYSFVSACSIPGDEYDVSFVATDSKPGAADLRDTARMVRALQTETASGRRPIAVFHGGYEYSERPSANVRRYFEQAASAGAVLGIGHHPHVPQGFGYEHGKLVAYSLGNFVFDQDRMETMVGLVAEATLEDGALTGFQALPVYLEDYRPRLVTGALASSTLRRISELSAENGVQTVISNGRVVVLPQGVAPVTAERELEVEVEVSPQGFGVADLRSYLRANESVARVELLSGGVVVPGRDVLRVGDFEDDDVDLDQGELPRWDVEAQGAFECLTGARSGTSGLCLGHSPQQSDTRAYLRNRVRAPQDGQEPPNRELTLVSWVRQDGAGLRVSAEFYAVEGEATFGRAELMELSRQKTDWKMVTADIALPPEPAQPNEVNAPRALMLELEWLGAGSKQNRVAVDDLAVVAWERRLAGGFLAFASPNPNDFVRVEAPPGRQRLKVVVRSYALP